MGCERNRRNQDGKFILFHLGVCFKLLHVNVRLCEENASRGVRRVNGETITTFLFYLTEDIETYL